MASGTAPVDAPPDRYVDELDEMLQQPERLVLEYLPVAEAAGVTEAQLRAWLSNVDVETGLRLSDQERLLGYPEVAELFGVELDTVRQWSNAYKRAVRLREPVTTACFIAPNITQGTKVRLWDRARCILFGWRTGRLKPGTLIPIKRKPTGAPPGNRHRDS